MARQLPCSRAFSSQLSHVGSSVAATDFRPGLTRICSSRTAQTRAEDRDGHAKRNHGSEPQARDSTPSPIGSVAIGSAPTSPSQSEMDEGGAEQRDEQPVAARGRNAAGCRRARPPGERDRQHGHDRRACSAMHARRRSRSARSRPSRRDVHRLTPHTRPRAKPLAM